MNLQWSIQSSHTQLVLNQVVYLNYRNEHIWPPHKEMITNLRSFSFGFCTNHNIWSFLENTSIFEISAWNFLYFNIENEPLAFWAPYISIKKSFSLFPSQILVCAMAFAAHYLFSFSDLHLLSSLSKNIKIKVGRHIGTSLCKYQDHQDYWPIIHDKLEDLFTTITHSFQDFSHKDICAYKTS